ncbi:DUF4230 domain-containing protein [uncultured Fretibacterium sp.]|uniref:DUF4230 domain-containing protein n=1 Tax=uncultured Fretibacterium sp. TaxID=1678694 RepID=UPI00262BC96C|nr:DUF4230 domain-containing protein [uncultured Fretibacterium sp.]
MSIIVALLLVLSVVLNVLLLTRKKNPAARKKSVRSAILQGIQNVNELATVRERFQSIVSFSDGKQMPLLGFCLPGTTRKFIMRYAGVIVCGNDLSKLNISERFAVNRVRVVVPRSRILDIYADIQSFEVYDQQAGLFTSIRLEDQNREVTADLEEMRQNALKSGILSQADENTRRILTSIVATTGMEAEIVFDDGEGEVLRLETQDSTPEKADAEQDLSPASVEATADE